MAESRVIFLIVAAIIAGSLLLLSTNILQGVRSQVGKIVQIGEAEVSKFNPGGLYSACEYWLALQSERYNSEIILKRLKLPDLMFPYSRLKSCCGEILKELAEKCYQGGVRRGECAGNGYIDAEALDRCVTACENIIRIYDACETRCPKKVYSCMNYLIINAGRNICYDSFENLGITDRTMGKACGE